MDEHIALVYSGNDHGGHYDIFALQSGDVFTINRSGDGQLSGRTMIVTALTRPSVQAIGIHNYENPRLDKHFLKSHRKPVSTNDTSGNNYGSSVHIKFNFPRTTKLREGAWVNLTEVWTVNKVSFRLDGKIVNFDEVARDFLEVQEELRQSMTRAEAPRYRPPSSAGLDLQKSTPSASIPRSSTFSPRKPMSLAEAFKLAEDNESLEMDDNSTQAVEISPNVAPRTWQARREVNQNNPLKEMSEDSQDPGIRYKVKKKAEEDEMANNTSSNLSTERAAKPEGTAHVDHLLRPRNKLFEDTITHTPSVQILIDSGADIFARLSPQTNIAFGDDSSPKKPLAPDNYEYGNNSEGSEQSSVWDDRSLGQSSTTSVTHGIIGYSVGELSHIVLDYTRLAGILEASATYTHIQQEIVLKEFKSSLECYYRALKDLSNTTELKSVCQLLKKSRRIIVNQARQLLRLPYNQLLLPQSKENTGRPTNKVVLDYLLRLSPGTPGKRKAPAVPDWEKGNMQQDKHSEENDSGSDSDAEEDSFLEISAAIIAFLKDGTPMQEFEAKLRRSILDEVWKEEIMKSPTALPCTLPNLVATFWGWLCFPEWERKLSPGKRRIRWTCGCGAQLYDDFDMSIGNTKLNNLQHRLNSMNLEDNRRDGGPSQPTHNKIYALLRDSRFIQAVLSYIERWQSRESPTPGHHAIDTETQTNASVESGSGESLYLLHCNSTSQYGAKVAQDLIPDNLSDIELFRFLKSIYCRVRKDAKFLTLRSTTSIMLCKFLVDHSSYALIKKHDPDCVQSSTRDCFCLPPRSLIGQQYGYRCHPTPPDPMVLPPFERNYLMHYFLNPDHLSSDQVWVYNQLPKRIDGPVKPGFDQALPAWGIFFEDGWDLKTIYLLVSLATLVSSLIFGVCWSVFKLDVQAAFGITSYWVTTVSLGLGYLTLHSVDKL